MKIIDDINGICPVIGKTICLSWQAARLLAFKQSLMSGDKYSIYRCPGTKHWHTYTVVSTAEKKKRKRQRRADDTRR